VQQRGHEDGLAVLADGDDAGPRIHARHPAPGFRRYFVTWLEASIFLADALCPLCGGAEGDLMRLAGAGRPACCRQ
jgi:hypothetical protein